MHLHGNPSSVVIEVINNVGIARVELENHAPVGLHRDRPVLGLLTLELAFGKSAESWLGHQAAYDLWAMQSRKVDFGVQRIALAFA